MSKYEKCLTLVFSDFYAPNKIYSIIQAQEHRWKRESRE